jgi:hypothetical protein
MTSAIYAVSNQIRKGAVTVATEVPDYGSVQPRNLPVARVAPLDRPYNEKELEVLGQELGARKLTIQAHSARMYFHHSVVEVDGTFQHYQGVQIYFSHSVERDGKVVSGRKCGEEESIVVGIEAMRALLAPANLLYRQPMPFNPGQYTMWNGLAIGLGQTFVVENLTVTDIRTGEKHELGTVRIYMLPQVFQVLCVTQMTADQAGKMPVITELYQRYFGKTGLSSFAAVDWLNAHVAAHKGQNPDKIREIMKLRKVSPVKDGTRDFGYTEEEVTEFFNSLDAFEAHRNASKEANYRWAQENPKAE